MFNPYYSAGGMSDAASRYAKNWKGITSLGAPERMRGRLGSMNKSVRETGVMKSAIKLAGEHPYLSGGGIAVGGAAFLVHHRHKASGGDNYYGGGY